jgi:uncharacterized protein
VYPFRRLSPKVQLTLGIAVLAIGSSISAAMGWQMDSASQDVVVRNAEYWQPSAESLNSELMSYRGGWLAQIPERVASSLDFHTGLIFDWWFWRAAGLMLIGMALFQLDVFSARRTRAFYTRLALGGLLAGLPIVAYGIYRDAAVRWDMRFSEFLGEQFKYWGSLLVAWGYVGLVMLMCQSEIVTGLRRRLEAVGRLAFTNYLLHSIVCTTIFYGHGLGLFGYVERTWQIVITAGIWLVQLVISPIWLRHFYLGPFEWAWRALTYGTLPPFRRAEFYFLSGSAKT